MHAYPSDVPSDVPSPRSGSLDIPTDYYDSIDSELFGPDGSYEPIDPSEFGEVVDPSNLADPSNTLDFPEMPSDAASPSTPSAPSTSNLPPAATRGLSAAALRALGELGINTDQLDMSDFNNWEYEEPPPDLSTPDGSSSTTKPPSDTKPPGSSTSTDSNWMKDLLKLIVAGGLGYAASKSGSGRGTLKPVGGKGPDPKARRWDPKTQTYYSNYTGERIYKAAGGGISGLPRNEYKAGGRYLSGPGDGMSDNIKANIDGVQEARLADGEFVIPADVVSHIGNGSSNAGAKKLHDMMNRIRHARTGNPRQGRQIKAEKYLPV